MKIKLFLLFFIFGIAVQAMAQSTSTPSQLIVPHPTPSTNMSTSNYQLWFFDPSLTSNFWSQITTSTPFQSSKVSGLKASINTFRGHYALLAQDTLTDKVNIFGNNPITSSSSIHFDIGPRSPGVQVHVIFIVNDTAGDLFHIFDQYLYPGHYRLSFAFNGFNNDSGSSVASGTYVLNSFYDGSRLPSLAFVVIH